MLKSTTSEHHDKENHESGNLAKCLMIISFARVLCLIELESDTDGPLAHQTSRADKKTCIAT